ncbi:MAG: transglycosylase domain-containing protein [Patescibacteria group bacterium]|nr:transglycosylase domain-containing protein [Patescibacteria group bacterium]
MSKENELDLLVHDFGKYISKKILNISKNVVLVFAIFFTSVGWLTIKFFLGYLKLLSYCFKRIKITFFHFVYIIQLIGWSTIIFGLTLVLLLNKLLEGSGLKAKHNEKAPVEVFYANLFESANKNQKALIKCIKNYGKTIRETRIAIPKRYTYAVAGATFILFVTVGAFYALFLRNLPSPYDLMNKPLPQSSQVLDKNGKILYVIYNGEVNRIPVSLNKIPDVVKQATIAYEDKDFYNHRGISIKGLARAFINNLEKKPVQGGSTITQQLVKVNLLRDNRRVMERKIKEAYLALLVDIIYPKDKILEMYLNSTPYGGTAYGIEAASRKYFGKKTSELDLAEASLLASLPSSPTKNSPYLTKRDVYKKNQKRVLDAMVEKKFITKKQADDAYKKELVFYSIDNQIQAPHFVFWVIDELEHKYGKKLVQEGGLTIRTTLDLPIQLMAEKIVKENVEEVEQMYWISNAASLVTEPRNGRILAMVGSRDYFDDKHEGQVNVTVARRQPGSSIKMVNYAYALSWGKFTPGTIIVDSPVSYSNAWETYAPVNYDGKFRGPVTLKQALAMSLNIPAVKVLNTYGPDKMVELGRKMGIESWKNLKNYGLSLTLGAGDVKMTELATAYGVLPNMGVRRDLKAVEKITDRNGKTIEENEKTVNKSLLAKMGMEAQASAADGERVIPETTAYQLTNILSDNDARMPAFGPYAKLEIPEHKVAVKTGTTNEKRDNWTIGYTPDFLVATWVGNNNNSPMNPTLTSGITGAAPIWNEIMTNVLKGKSGGSFDTPTGMVKVKICAVNGLLPCARCPKMSEEYFVPGTEPKTHCYFPSINECKVKREQMTTENKTPDEINKALVNCPAEAAAPNPTP